MKRFDPKALYQALDEKREARELSWREVAAEIGVSASTITRTRTGDGWKLTVCWQWWRGWAFPWKLLFMSRPTPQVIFLSGSSPSPLGNG